MKALTKYFKNRKVTINFLLEKPARAYTPATFHKLHVEIKKLNAFFKLLKFCSKDFKRKKVFKPFKLIFRHAGMVRELQVEETMLEKYFINNLLKEYKNSLKEFHLKERKDFFSILNKTFVARLKKKYGEIVPFLKKMDRRKVNIYLKKHRNKIKKLLRQDTLKTSQVHTLRKRLKKFNYNLKSLNLEKQHKLPPKKDVLPEFLGKWHDCQVIIRHLKEAMDTVKVNPKEISQLKKIKAKIFSDSQLLFKKINAAIRVSEFL